MKTFTMNLKAVISPKGFIDLGLSKRKFLALYGIFMMLITVLLCDVLPMQLGMPKVSGEICDFARQYVPEFEIENNEITFNDDLEYILPGEGALWYFNTSVTAFSDNYNDTYYAANYIPEGQENGLTNAFFVSRTNIVTYNGIQFQKIQVRDLTQVLGWQNRLLTKDTMIASLPGWIQTVMNIYYGLLVIGMPISLFFFSLLWTVVVALAVNSIANGKYPFRVLYAAVVYIRVIVLFVHHAINRLSFVSSTQAAWICRLLMLLFIILAIVMKVNKDGSYSPGLVDIKYGPGGYVVGTFDNDNFPNNNYPNNGFSNDAHSGQSFAPLGGNQPLRQNTGYNPNPAYSANQPQNPGQGQYGAVYQPQQVHQNTGYNPNPAYSANAQTGTYQEPQEPQYGRPDLAQDKSFAAQTPVWKQPETKGHGGLGEQAYTSQEWRPQAHTDYAAEKKKWNEASQKWNPDMQPAFTQEWNPQRPNKPEDDLFSGGANVWEQQQKWRGTSDKSNPTMGTGNSAANEQWNQSPVWGKKE